jgi:class 3 adenylate cyclase
MSETRKIAAILVADVVGYSRLAGADEERILARLRALRSDLIDPTIAIHHGRIVKRTGDGSIVEFRSVVDAVRCAIEVQNAMVDRNAGVSENRRIVFRIGIHLGDVMEESDGDLMGEGVNIAARLEGICEPGAVCLSGAAYEQVRDRVRETFIDLGEKVLKNVERPVRVYAAALDRAVGAEPATPGKHSGLSLPDKPSIAVLPFQNMSGDPEQEYFSDGISEDIITALSKLRWFFVIARNSSFTYKGKAVHMKQVADELGVGYVLEGSVRKGAIAFALRPSSTKSPREAISGRSAMTASWLTCFRCRTKLPRRSSPQSSLSSTPRKISAPNASRPTAWMRGIW